MNIEPVITMDKDKAHRRLEAYRESVRRRHDDEHAALVKGYEALAEGTPLISLTEAIEQGGAHDDGRPRLAVARADRRQVEVSAPWHSRRLTFDSRANTNTWSAYTPPEGRERLQITLNIEGYAEMSRGYALVPIIPAEVRNAMTGQPHAHLILWEVERWSSRRITAEPDRDPLLLRQIGGDLYAIMAQWNLTEIERFVMRGRIG